MEAPSLNTEPLKRTPLFEAARSAGARMVPFAGWEMAVQFTGLLEEHKAVRERCGLFDISHMGVLRVSGPGAKDALQGLVPTDLFRIGPGEACYTVLLNEQGGIRDDLIVYDRGWDNTAQAQELILVINASCAEDDTAWIRKKLKPAGIDISDYKRNGVLMALQGPKAEAELQEMSDTDLRSLPRFGHRMVKLNEFGTAFVARTGYTGEDGFELLMECTSGQQFWKACMERDITACGLGARDTLRLEAAMHLYGNDMNADTTPLEVGLGWLVHLEMPKPFVGRQALEQQSAAGAEQRLIGLRLKDKAIPRPGYAIYQQNKGEDFKPIGHVTSGGWSPTLEAGIALALVPVKTARIGTEVEVEIRGKRHIATVCKRPFYRPSTPQVSSTAFSNPANGTP